MDYVDAWYGENVDPRPLDLRQTCRELPPGSRRDHLSGAAEALNGQRGSARTRSSCLRDLPTDSDGDRPLWRCDREPRRLGASGGRSSSTPATRDKQEKLERNRAVFSTSFAPQSRSGARPTKWARSCSGSSLDTRSTQARPATRLHRVRRHGSMARRPIPRRGIHRRDCSKAPSSHKARDTLQQRFLAGEFQVLVSTDAGGEGIDLQSAHVMVDWDIPWSLVRLEQRMGRLHRIGQTTLCTSTTWSPPSTREGRVQEVMLHEPRGGGREPSAAASSTCSMRRRRGRDSTTHALWSTLSADPTARVVVPEASELLSQGSGSRPRRGPPAHRDQHAGRLDRFRGGPP